MVSADPTGVHAVVVDAPTAQPRTRTRLVCVNGDELGRTILVAREPVVIGRGGEVDVALGGSEISRRHARLTCEAGRVTIEDLGSANGTYVNGRRVGQPTVLAIGDRIQVGASVFLLSQHDELEERLERVQRLDAMAVLAGGIAHDFNNVLAAIVCNVDMVETALPTDARDALDALESIRRASSSATYLVRRLLRLGRAEPLTFEVVQLAELVELAIGSVRRQAGGKVRFEIDAPPSLALHGAYEELSQMLTNLCLNARDAMPGGGTITIRARAISLSLEEALAHDLATAGAYVELAVSDTGCGMDDETQRRAFDPFFTTKPIGHGTGLGLAMVHAGVRRHGGAIELASTPGKGTTVRMLFHAPPG